MRSGCKVQGCRLQGSFCCWRAAPMHPLKQSRRRGEQASAVAGAGKKQREFNQHPLPFALLSVIVALKSYCGGPAPPTAAPTAEPTVAPTAEPTAEPADAPAAAEAGSWQTRGRAASPAEILRWAIGDCSPGPVVPSARTEASLARYHDAW